ncbi:hypothetical protein Goshw_014611 [Gossypium schwendimanii]|uniref:Uncharacterized protein n=1 Tax=Gossypium schwendimanii TaxID=34291 RepID=A0A7J9M423_GOSSC|nr:hypothetical protein [Gossypium schwendimanii]
MEAVYNCLKKEYEDMANLLEGEPPFQAFWFDIFKAFLPSSKL